MDGSVPRTVLNHYIRIKIFTDRGKESEGKVDIPYRSGNKISDIAGRTIKPDGTIVELKKDSVFERTIVKSGDVKVKAKSFAMPAVEPGAIIEYRWRETHGDSLAFYLRLHFQRDIPVEVVKYYLKPLSLPGFDFSMRTMSFRVKFEKFNKEKDGFYSVQETNVPAGISAQVSLRSKWYADLSANILFPAQAHIRCCQRARQSHDHAKAGAVNEQTEAKGLTSSHD